MASGGQKRTRQERVASLELPPGRWERAWTTLRRRDVLLGIALCVVAACAMCVVMGGWHAPCEYRSGYVLSRNATARVALDVPDGRGGSIQFQPGDTLVEAGHRLTAEEVGLLRLEHRSAMAARPLKYLVARSAAVVGLVLALYAICALYLRRRQQTVKISLKRLATMLILSVVAVAMARWAALDPWRAEVVPLLVFAQILAVYYRQETALLFAGMLTLLVVVALGQSLGGLMLLMGTNAIAVLQLSRIRNRSKLIYVGFFTGLGAMLLSVAVAVLEDQPVSLHVFQEAVRLGIYALATGFLLTGILPFIERLFGVLTDMSLLELGDVSHPLLQELVRRAPSTYNHSVTVGAIAEAAADAIGARGLLVRVGAYFHDIGKMLKPEYFIENQPLDENRHASLIPAMSTLVIIAHIKDGADLARKHKLPQPIIDFIEQHHGTTLVEYFYGRANELRRSDPNGGNVDESSFRYPGPKPQTKETAVLMLADAAESACRSLVDPAPSRIESLVREVAERKLADGQFDDTNLTLHELRTIQNSMIKSLIANYHGRLKYPGQRTA
jgi:putative nucleotidyltransferase with HDIG domain